VRLTLTALPPDEWSRRPDRPNYRLRFANGGKSPAVIHEAGFWVNHEVVLRNADGEEPPLRPLGKELRDGVVRRFGDRDHDIDFVLETGKELIENARIDVETMYRLAPGNYTLTVVYWEKMGDLLKVESNKAPFVMKPVSQP